jgi:serralysin
MCILCSINSPTWAEHVGFAATEIATGIEANSSGKVSFTYEQAAEQIAVAAWTMPTPAPITYAFRSTSTDSSFVRLNTTQMAAVERALTAWSDVAEIDFVRVGQSPTTTIGYSNSATMLFSGSTIGPYARAYLPGSMSNSALAGDVILNVTNNNFANPGVDSYAYMAIIHEIGHAIGLGHPGAYNGGAPSYAASAEYAEDTRQYSVMSYFPAESSGAVHGHVFAATPLLHDIAAVQLLYGANMQTRTGNTTYGFNASAGAEAYAIADGSNPAVFAVWDAGGYDTLDFSGYSATQMINLEAEGFSDVGGLRDNVAIAAGVVIEAAIGGSGADTVIGNAWDNWIHGGNGTDHLTGKGGNDTLVGGAGDDTLDGGADADLLQGGTGQDVLRGGTGNDILEGGDGDDYLDGGAGDDVLDGGAGSNNWVMYDSVAAGVTLSLQAGTATGQGTDTLLNVQHVRGSAAGDSITGSAVANVLMGGDGGDVLVGLDGNDFLDGGAGADVLVGGSGGDYLRGGAGADVFRFGSFADSGIANGIDYLDSFDAGSGDRIDLSEALGGRALTFNSGWGSGVAMYAFDMGPVAMVQVYDGKSLAMQMYVGSATQLKLADFLV